MGVEKFERATAVGAESARRAFEDGMAVVASASGRASGSSSSPRCRSATSAPGSCGPGTRSTPRSATHELRARAMGWYERRPTDGPILVVAHGGPIAAIRGTLAGRPAHDWLGLVPPPGGVVLI